MERKLIYILNSYSKNSVQHFFHVMHLLECIADQGVVIALVIEKCEDEPKIRNKNITVIPQREKIKWKRAIELYRIIRNLVKHQGYRKIFVRISKYAAIISKLVCRSRGEVYYWLSGASLEFYKGLPWPERIKYYIKDYSVYKLVTSMVDYFVTGPEYMVDYYATVGCVKKGKIRLLYNDIDTSRFKVVSDEEKIALRDELGVRRDAIVILLLHRYSNVRRTPFYIPYVLSGLREKNNIEVIMIGDGPEKDIVEAAIKRSGLTFVRMLDSQPNSTVQKYYQACDIFINPSWTEGFPRVIIEAMACGKPIVATAAGGTRDLFGEMQQTYIVETDDRDGFADALDEMVGNAQLRDQCGNENLERVRRYDTQSVAKMYVELFWGVPR